MDQILSWSKGFLPVLSYSKGEFLMDLYLYVIYSSYNECTCKFMYCILPNFCLEGGALGISTAFTGSALHVISLGGSISLNSIVKSSDSALDALTVNYISMLKLII